MGTNRRATTIALSMGKGADPGLGDKAHICILKGTALPMLGPPLLVLEPPPAPLALLDDASDDEVLALDASGDCEVAGAASEHDGISYT